LLVGEAPGYRGCRETGIPFSSSNLLLTSNHPFIRRIRKKIKLDTDIKESTANIVWQYLEDAPSVPLFWNAYPFHPHRKNENQSNRKPNATEIKQGIHYLQMLGEIFRLDRVAGVGRSGVQAAEKAFPKKDIIYIRHPSYGGKNDFITGMTRFLP